MVAASAEYEIKLRDSFSKGFTNLENKMNRFEKNFNGFSTVFKGTFASNLVLRGLDAVARGVENIFTNVVKLTGELEQTKIAFSTMLQDESKALGLIKELRDFAAVTPFSQREVLTGAKQLLAYGFESSEMVKNLTMLGDIASGLAIPLGDLVYLHGTLRAQGRAYKVDIKQLAGRGIPIYKYLAKVLQTDVTQLDNFIKKGKVGFKEVEKAMKMMTGEGGQFGGMMDKQSKSLFGLWSTFKDYIEIAFANIGEKFLTSWKSALTRAIEFAKELPKMDFSVVGDSFSPFFGALGQFMRLLGWKNPNDGLTTFQLMDKFFKSIGKTIFVMLTPLTVLVDIVILLVETLKQGAMILDEIAHGKDPFKAGGSAWGNMKNTWVEMRDRFENQWKALNTPAHDFGADREAWDKHMAGMKERLGKKFGWKSTSTPLSSDVANPAGGNPIGLEKIISGTRNIKIDIKQLVGEVTFTKSYEQSEAQMVSLIQKALVVAVNDANIVAS